MMRIDRPLDNPINWSFRAGRLFGVDIRIHILFVLGAVILFWMELGPRDLENARSLSQILLDAFGTYAILFFVVLCHEFGHCFGARYVGGDADEILLWPLGGLASTNPPPNPVAHMITTAAGPLVNVAFCAISSVSLALWLGTPGAVPWNPLNPFLPIHDALTVTTGQAWLMRFFGISYVLLLINLLPIYPFDGGRLVQAWLWPRKGYRASMEIACGTGMVGAILVGLFAIFADRGWLLLTIAVFGYLTCWQERRRAREGAFDGPEPDYDFAGDSFSVGDEQTKPAGPGLFERRRRRKAAVRAERLRLRRERQVQEVEEILRKVSETGLASLSARERRILEEETHRRRASESSPQRSGRG